MKKKCEYDECGKEFTPKNPKGRFCSDKCRVYAGRKNKNKKGKRVKAEKKKEPVKGFKITPKAIGVVLMDKNNKIQDVVVMNITKPKTLDDIKSMCPPNLKGLDRSQWIATERQKYNI